MQYLKYLMASAILTTAVAVQADHLHGPAPEPGDETRNWLELQRSGQHASETPQPLSGEVAAVIYQRFTDSFAHPIPEYYSGEEADSATVGD